MKSNPRSITEQVLVAVGGADNVQAFEHCATRLRLIVKDKDLIDKKAVESVAGVSGAFYLTGQYQAILGTG